jgi:hypothetical protein
LAVKAVNDLIEGRKARIIAFYLPQFHPVPENDEWWGKGFTEWTNTAKAKPLFRGHYQPHIPADLGFYDLRLSETRIAQAKMAREYGIEGFCYWHYWFGGKRILERPFTEVLKSGEPDFPFCLGWANDSWTGIWHGCADRMLIEQTYPGPKDEEAHFYSLLDAFGDDRYIKVDGKPVFLIYKPYRLPEPKRFIDHWKNLAVKSGLNGIYFVANANSMRWRADVAGFDALIPHNPGITTHYLFNRPPGFADKVCVALTGKNVRLLRKRYFPRPDVLPYSEYIRFALPPLRDDFDEYPCVLPNWDNTPRCGRNGFLFQDATPELFRSHLRQAIGQVEARPHEKRIVFIKSWNEWAEGNYLEPDQQYGLACLEACRAEVFPDLDVASVDVHCGNQKGFRSLASSVSRFLRGEIKAHVQHDRGITEEKLFHRSANTIYLMDAKSGYAGITPVSQVDILSPMGDIAPALPLRARGEDPGVELPEVPHASDMRLILKIDITSPEATMLQLYYKTSSDRHYSESKSRWRSLYKGRNIVFIALPREKLLGRLRLDPGKQPGDYLIHSIEMREVSE